MVGRGEESGFIQCCGARQEFLEWLQHEVKDAFDDELRNIASWGSPCLQRPEESEDSSTFSQCLTDQTWFDLSLLKKMVLEDMEAGLTTQFGFIKVSFRNDSEKEAGNER